MGSAENNASTELAVVYACCVWGAEGGSRGAVPRQRSPCMVELLRGTGQDERRPCRLDYFLRSGTGNDEKYSMLSSIRFDSCRQWACTRYTHDTRALTEKLRQHQQNARRYELLIYNYTLECTAAVVDILAQHNSSGCIDAHVARGRFTLRFSELLRVIRA